MNYKDIPLKRFAAHYSLIALKGTRVDSQSLLECYYRIKKEKNMSKKINEKKAAIDATATKTQTGDDLKALFEAYPNVSIRQLSLALGVTYGLVLKASKAPIPGTAYDPEAINWNAFANEFTKRNKSFLEPDVDWKTLNESKTGKATLVKDMSKFEVGSKVYLRRNNDKPYTIVYKTDTHIVIQLEDTTEPLAWSHQTFLYNGPVFEPRIIEDTEVAE